MLSSLTNRALVQPIPFTDNAIGSFVTEAAYPIEMETSGFAKWAIPEFREAIRGSSTLPSATRITVTRSPTGEDACRVRKADEIAQKLGIVATGEAAPETFGFAFGDLLQRDDTDQLLYGLGGFSDAQVHWEVPTTQEGAAPDPVYFDAAMQLSFCLA